MKFWPTVKWLFQAAWLLLSWSATLVAWVVYLLHWLGGARRDAHIATHSFDGEFAICPRSHRTRLAGVWRCGACGWTAEVDNPWRCTHRACGAVTPYIPCEICGLSIRNPYRRGGV